MWLYKDAELTEVPDGFVGFVYIIENLKTGKQYIGKKNFYSTRRKKVAGKVKRKVVKATSDWRDYYGSSDTLLADIQDLGLCHFRREVLYLCRNKAEMSYLEIKEQIDREVLFKPDSFYNNFIGCRIHGKHLRSLIKK